MEPEILFEDESFLVLVKPANWVVNDATTVKDVPTVQQFLSSKFSYPIANSQEFRSGIVHRLDKETSGLLLIAKNQVSFTELQREFKERLVKKEYIALAHGKTLPEGEIDITVGRLPWNRKRFGVLPGGRESKTSYELISYYFNPEKKEYYSLLRLKPLTGRTHQIRIHLKHIGHPIVADSFYAGRKTSRNDRNFCPRLFLHASKISFTHPEKGNEVLFESDLPDELTSVLSKLQKVV